MTNRELERKVNIRRIAHAIFSVSVAINGLGVVETVALACEDPISGAMSASIAGEVSRLRNVLTTLNEARESLEGERMPIEFSEERLLNNEWMDLGTAVSAKTASDGDDFAPNVINDTIVGLKNVVRDPIGGPAPNLDEHVEASWRWEDAFDVFNRNDIERRFTYHPPKAEQLSVFSTIRNAGMEMALSLFGLCPESEERDRAIEAVDMAVMWANASIARHVR